jgi:AraC family transcriptional regulator, transcriptional activator of pobA
VKQLPVLHIEQFQEGDRVFYVNRLSVHLKKHHLIHHPHKHDFYLCVLFTKGKGEHEIDFKTYDVSPGTIFFLKPGQMHNWKLSPDTEGYIFFHSRDFYDMNYQSRQLRDLPFYSSLYNVPVIRSEMKMLKQINEWLELMLVEYSTQRMLKQEKLVSLVDLVYIDLVRLYKPAKRISGKSLGYLEKLGRLEKLIDNNFKEQRSPSFYADKMNITLKHLNRIVNASLNKTVTEMIADRVILEAKRMLIHDDLSVAQISDALGFTDHSYFIRYFKKHTGLTPVAFINESK